MQDLRQSALYWLCEKNAEEKVLGVLALKDFLAFSKASYNTCPADQYPCALQGIENHSTLKFTAKTEIPGRPNKQTRASATTCATQA